MRSTHFPGGPVLGCVVPDIPAFCRELVAALAEQQEGRGYTPVDTPMRGETGSAPIREVMGSWKT